MNTLPSFSPLSLAPQQAAQALNVRKGEIALLEAEDGLVWVTLTGSEIKKEWAAR